MRVVISGMHDLRVGVLYSPFDGLGNKEVEKDLREMGVEAMKALKRAGYETELMDIDQLGLHGIKAKNLDLIFNVCERLRGDSQYEPHIATGLEMLKVNFTGCPGDVLTLCNNKVLAKRRAQKNNIRTPPFNVFTRPDDPLKVNVKYPQIVKPALMHNSIGIFKNSIVNNEQELRERVKEVIEKFDQPVISEEFIEGVDYEISLFGNGGSAKILPIVEIWYPEIDDPYKTFFSYESKWTKGKAESGYYDVPENLNPKTEQMMIRAAKKCYQLFGLRDYGRLDFRLSKDGKLYLIEATANTGLSNETSTMVAAEHVGLDHHEALHEIFLIAAKRCNVLPKKSPLRITEDCMIASG